ncbi:MAG: alpha-E domain-containing protein [Clostridia bacterium]|nr:alpha-E domain-containing protein [Clostridia bacterium]
MSVISAEKADNLFWLGRYVERAFTTVKFFMEKSDQMLDGEDDLYIKACDGLGLDNVYESNMDFIARYPFDESNPKSIASCFNRAMDNAIILRETVGSETLSYLQLAQYDLKEAANSPMDILDLQSVLDHIFAFWGSLEDNVFSEDTRNLVKAGKRLERLDLLLRLGSPAQSQLIAAYQRLKVRLERSPINFNEDNFATLYDIITAEPFDKWNAVSLLSKVMEN